MPPAAHAFTSAYRSAGNQPCLCRRVLHFFAATRTKPSGSKSSSLILATFVAATPARPPLQVDQGNRQLFHRSASQSNKTFDSAAETIRTSGSSHFGGLTLANGLEVSKPHSRPALPKRRFEECQVALDRPRGHLGSIRRRLYSFAILGVTSAGVVTSGPFVGKHRMAASPIGRPRVVRFHCPLDASRHSFHDALTGLGSGSSGCVSGMFNSAHFFFCRASACVRSAVS